MLGGCATRSAPAPALAPTQTITPADAAQLSAQAEQALAAGRLADGGAAYVRIVTAFPDDAQAWFRLGTIYLRSQQYAAAQMACDHALRLDPTMAKARANLALAHLYQFRAAASLAIASTDVPESNRKAFTALLRDVDHAVNPARTAAPPVRDETLVAMPPAPRAK